MTTADHELLTALLDMDAAAYVIDLHDDDCDNLHCPGCATDTEDTTPAMRTPLFTDAAAHAAGLDIVPTPTELLDAAQNVIGMWGNRGADPDNPVEVTADAGAQLARAVPLLLARIAELDAERHTTNEALSDAAEALRAAITPTGHDPVDDIEYKVIGGWGVAGAESAEQAVAAVHAARRAHPWDHVYAQQRTVRWWDDDSQWYGPWTDVPGAEEPAITPPPRQQEDPHDSPLHTTYAECRDLPATP